MVLLRYIGPEVHFRGPTELHQRFMSYDRTSKQTDITTLYMYICIYIIVNFSSVFIQLVLSI